MNRLFRLAALLRLRRHQEDQAATDLANASRHADQARERSRTHLESLAEHRFPDGCAPAHWQAAVASRAAMVSNVVEARAAQEAAELEVAQTTDAWRRAHQRTTALERLSERHDANVRRSDLRREQTVLDEIAGQRRGQTQVRQIPPTEPGQVP